MKSNELTIAKRDTRAVATAFDNATFTSAIDESILTVITKAGGAFVLAYNEYEAQAQGNEWKRCYLLAKIFDEYKALNPKATATDFASYFRRKSNTMSTDIKCGRDVTITKGENGSEVVDFPRDVNGEAFTVYNYNQIYKYKDRIKDGYFLATDKQKALKDKIDLLRGVVKTIDEKTKDEKPTEAQIAEAIEAVIKDEPEEKPEVLAVYKDGVKLELTAKQIEAILKIIG